MTSIVEDQNEGSKVRSSLTYQWRMSQVRRDPLRANVLLQVGDRSAPGRLSWQEGPLPASEINKDEQIVRDKPTTRQMGNNQA